MLDQIFRFIGILAVIGIGVAVVVFGGGWVISLLIDIKSWRTLKRRVAFLEQDNTRLEKQNDELHAELLRAKQGPYRARATVASEPS